MKSKMDVQLILAPENVDEGHAIEKTPVEIN
jgi:hypothetical protein